jgi:hypothetical protein
VVSSTRRGGSAGVRNPVATKGSGRREWYRLAGIFGILVLLVVGVGCSYIGFGSNQNQYANPNAQYFKGSQGIVTRFDNFPTMIYYNGPQDPAGNTFTFGVEARNRGASFSRGGVYLSGYDPNLLYFDWLGGGYHPSKGGLSPCGMSIGSVGFGQIGGIFRCDGVQVGAGSGVTNIRVDSIGKLIGTIQGRHEKATWLNGDWDTALQFSSNPAGNTFTMNFARGQIEYFQHGRLFIAVLAAIDFIKNGGREFLLAGNTYEFPGGELAYFDYAGHVIDWPAGLDQTRQNLMLTSCYQYTTYSDPVICVDPDPVSDHRKVCRPRQYNFGGGGQGGPVAVTSVEQENTPRKIVFRINVKNVGSGTVYDPGSLEKCSPYSPDRATPADLNIVYLGDVRIGQVGLRTAGANTGMLCYPDVIRLDPNTRAGSTTCTYPIEYGQIKSAYETPLIIELWYGYSETQQRQLLLKRLI